ncbi:unnamed protein product [Vitrella brassicaformis CCMP3155]|uniref:Uncharacterized protein n=1 Tax=Vitrella brassicaformis (strain CCMP3155) TaxID=1169540 RepID=A0A0G4EXE4_VITBC|nr:unnamed protein product [Vitrella brassicaformis CCMP3155]|eukprot:CEM02765.1 unnamed protein product [Vitrella brassicaformis CCMP3155]
MLAYSEMLDGCQAITEAVTSVSLMATPDMDGAGGTHEVRLHCRQGGHPTEDACVRVKAAIDARSEGADICSLARTDARASLGLDEAIRRCQAVHAMNGC